MRLLFIAMRYCGVRYGEDIYEPRNNKLYEHAGAARNYSMQYTGQIGIRPGLLAREYVIKADTGHTLMVDLDAIPRVKFDVNGKATGIARDDGNPTLLQKLENAEQQLETWAKQCQDIKARLARGEV